MAPEAGRVPCAANDAHQATTPAEPQFVSSTELERGLRGLCTLPGLPVEGFFGPNSVTWTVNRECALFLGAGRAALLQLAHPWVTAALEQHSQLKQDAIGRFHSTFRVIYTMLFGTRAQALRASEQLYRRHTGVRGELPETVGAYRAHTHYEANEAGALLWVYATLAESAVRAYEFVRPPLSPAEREQFYRESRRVGLLCGVPAEVLPPTWADLGRYVEQTMTSPVLEVNATARAMGQAVLSGVGTRVRPPRWYRALTASWLPPRLRDGFALPFGIAEERLVRRAAGILPRVYRMLPPAVRFVGPYHEASARLRRREPGWLTERSNRFWMGVPRLLHGGTGSQEKLAP